MPFPNGLKQKKKKIQNKKYLKFEYSKKRKIKIKHSKTQKNV
jgi:hypothetical protein